MTEEDCVVISSDKYVIWIWGNVSWKLNFNIKQWKKFTYKRPYAFQLEHMEITKQNGKHTIVNRANCFCNKGQSSKVLGKMKFLLDRIHFTIYLYVKLFLW